MHYANGRAAKEGDLVRGKGNNVKHEIIGILISANAAATTCNCTVAHVDVNSPVIARGWRTTNNVGVKTGDISWPCRKLDDGSWQVTPSEVIAVLEYGQLDAFVALDPKTGEVLPPEADPVADAVKADASERGIVVGGEITKA